MMNNNKYMYVKVQMVIYMYLTESHEMFSVSVFRAEHYLRFFSLFMACGEVGGG